ncbi:enolase 4-like isoform X2 [Biomphalaria glabrata]|uniref:Enolase 4 n=1 Tax=Biomphalaria glabrata TaxID=6526 RepID=A0A9W3BNU6_BIOGL|nr:enolase 4-like isoform X2 [Biomphalaria glabrata]
MAYASNNLSVLRQKAMTYYKENGIPKKIEEVLNAMFYENPSDPYGYLANYFSDYAESSKLKRISACMVYDGQGLPTLETNVYCTVNNKEKHICSTLIPNRDIKIWLEEREKAQIEIKASVLAAINLINCELNETLKGLDPLKQTDIDQMLLSFMEKKRQIEEKEKEKEKLSNEELPALSANATPAVASQVAKNKRKQSRSSAKIAKSGNVAHIPDRPLEILVSGSESVIAISQAVCLSAAISNNYRIYQHVANLMHPNVSARHYRIPLPMITILHGGKGVAGKQNLIKEFMVVPGINMPFEKGLQQIANINSHVSKTLSSKFGAAVKYVNENGTLCPPLDQPNQGLDLIIEAIHAQGLTVNKDMHLAINIAAHEFFDHDKGKYEVTESTWKSSEEMVPYTSELLTKYPSIVAVIDPLRGEESETWIKLCDKVSKSVYIVGDNFYSRPGLLIKEPAPISAFTSGIVMRLERLNTLSDIITCAKLYQALKNEIIISTNDFETTDTFLVDFSVGIKARFLKLGGIHTGERCCKINRMLQIYRELEHPEIKFVEEPSESETVAGETEEQVTIRYTVGSQEEPIVETVEEKEEAEIIKVPTPEPEDDGKFHLKLHESFEFPQINYPTLQNVEPVDAESVEQNS